MSVDNYAEILRRVAGRFLVLISMSGLWATILAAVVVAVVRTWIKSVSRNKALSQAAAGTPEMVEAAQTYAERERDRQRAFHGVELSLWEQLPGSGKIRKIERPALEAIEPPEIEDPAA
jgi:hypothetical protein